MKKILSLFVLIISCIAINAQTLDEIVAKHIDAVGGKDNWAKLKTFKMEGKVKVQGAEIKITLFQIDKKAMRQNINVMGMNGYSIVTNTEGWNYMPFQGQTKPEPITADDLKNAQEGLYIADDFITYTELGKKLELLGKDDIDGTECFKLKMTSKNAQETTYYIDPSNYYVLKKIEKIKANGQEQENATTYGNYKKLDSGIIIAMNEASGWGDMEITSAEVNPTIDETLFQLPK